MGLSSSESRRPVQTLVTIVLLVAAAFAGRQAAAAAEGRIIAPAAALGKTLPQELAALDTQFGELQMARAFDPFREALASLNAGYLKNLAAKIAEEKAAANLDGILALEAEQKLVAENLQIPRSDSPDTPASLKALRAIYRQAFDKLDAERAAALASLVGALEKRLVQMEADFVRTDRVQDAKVVREYRDALSAQGSVTIIPAAVQAPGDGSYTNSLGMKFVPVKGTSVLFCIHETRYRDYAAFAAKAAGVDSSWKSQTFAGHALKKSAEDHPVVNVSWNDATAFCSWLSSKENRTYRLPTDEEWSVAVGIARDEDRRKGGLAGDVSTRRISYPWGNDWPPPKQAGNYSDESRNAKTQSPGYTIIPGYNDGFPTTAPVMSFEPNRHGLYDLGGNVFEWCADWYDSSQQYRVLRGASWARHTSNDLSSSFRRRMQSDSRCEFDGFRVVLETKSDASPSGR